MNSQKKYLGFADNPILGLSFTLLVLFLVHRAQYIFMDKFSILRISSDAIWWWTIQRWYYYSGEGFDSSLIVDRINFRLPTDIFFQKAVVYFSKLLDVDLFSTNLVISIILFLILCISVYYLAYYVFHSGSWATVYSISFMFTAYPAFVRYPIITPKMFGFILFPIVIAELLKMVQHNKHYITGIFVLSLFLIFYIVSFVYTAGSLFLAVAIAGLYRYYDTEEFEQFKKLQLVFWIAICVVFIVIFYLQKGGFGKFKAPNLNITELYYSNHQANYHRFGKLLFSSYASFLSVIVGGYLTHRFCRNEFHRTQFLYFSAMYFGLMATSIAGQSLANEINSLRVLWLWRASHYAHLPAAFCLFIGLRSIQANYFLGKNYSNFLIVSIIAIYLLSSAHAARHFERRPLLSITWFVEYMKKSESQKNRSLQELINFANSLPKSSLILMPKITTQNADSDIFEAYSGVPLFLSRGERPHLIYKTNRTMAFANAIETHNQILNENNKKIRTTRMLEFASKNKITHVLVYRKKSNGLDAQIVFENEFWILYSTKQK